MADARHPLEFFIARQLADDERAMAALIVRGEPVWDVHGIGWRDVKPIRVAWEDQLSDRAILRTHARTGHGTCAACERRLMYPIEWPCDSVATLVSQWELRPGYRAEWSPRYRPPRT